MKLRERPLKLSKKKIKVDEFKPRHREIVERYTDLQTLYATWATAAQRALTTEVTIEEMSWQEFSQEETDEGTHRTPLGRSAWFLNYLEGLNSGFCQDVNWVHHARHRWYFDNVSYDMDVTLMLVKLLNNMRWARANNNKYLVSTEDAFPLMDYRQGVGPTIPRVSEMFGKRDAQFVVKYQDTLYYFETGVSGLTEARELYVMNN